MGRHGMNRNLLCATVALLALAATTASAATTYIANRAVGGGFVNLSITTDDTLGVLNTDNILDWDITVTNGLDVFNLQGPGGTNNSGRRVLGSAFTATASDLFFDFSSGSRQGFAVQTPGVGSGLQAWCVGTRRTCDDGGAEELIVADTLATIAATPRVGNLVIASVSGPVGVPEPTTWALLICGFGMAGVALRARRQVVAG